MNHTDPETARLHDRILGLEAELSRMRDLLRSENQRANDAIDREETAEQAADGGAVRAEALLWAADALEADLQVSSAMYRAERELIAKLRRLAGERSEPAVQPPADGAARHGLSVQHADALWDAVAIPGPHTPTFTEQHERVCQTVAGIIDELTPPAAEPTNRAAVPTEWIDGHPQLEAIAAAVWEQCRTEGTSIVADDPRNIAVAALVAVLPESTGQAAVLSEAERTMLTYALDQAQERIWSEGGFTAEDQAAVDSLRRLAAEAQQQPAEDRPSLRERHRAAWQALTPAEQDARIAALDAIDALDADEPDTEAPTARPTRYVVNLLPEDAAPDAHIFEITVEWRGDDRWAVLRHGWCLGSDGDWDYELRPSEREDDWLDAHRFDLDTALRLAKEQAPLVNVNGITAAEALKRHRADEPAPAEQQPAAATAYGDGKGRAYCLGCASKVGADVPLTADDVAPWELCPSCGRHVIDVARTAEQQPAADSDEETRHG